MAEWDKDDFAFINEKIKAKPVNKKRLLKHGAYTAGFAVLFGAVACFVFTFLQPFMENWLYPEDNPVVTIPKDSEQLFFGTEYAAETEEPGNASDTETPAVQAEEAAGTETPAPEAAAAKELEISDYQKLQNKIYAIGQGANLSVVTVTGVTSNTDWFNSAYESSVQTAGIIIDNNKKELLILTEHKAAAKAEKIRVTFIDGVTVNASLKKHDGNTGIAILSVPSNEIGESTKTKITYAKMGSLQVPGQGNIAIAVGNPLGTNYSIGIGTITSVDHVIQTVDAAYSIYTTDIVGSSQGSGVLLNTNGEIIGLLTQGYNETGADNTLAAISISEAGRVVEMLLKGQDIPYLGIIAADAPDGIAPGQAAEGILIKDVLMDSPAFHAGLLSGDVILEMDGKELLSFGEYESNVLSLEPGAEVELLISRRGMKEYLTRSVTADVLP